ncbi:hypothetical protein JQ604_11235 [Bradyrhizobium jicamae]|uniref:hypothetical protein n=1 Tax=Bradyrhizobium jicamae TaxID=280332 RepID=UPI001BAC6927|nr:hypothetical protein [Bradyrhizobium jicamae]MBR0752759.1 hypothetical protein [Bradyrhizobium jicamae]
MGSEYSNDWIDLSALSKAEQEEFKRLGDPAIIRGYGEFTAGRLDDRWIELYLKAARARAVEVLKADPNAMRRKRSGRR